MQQTVLVVNDLEDQCRYLEEVLRQPGYSVLTAADGVYALEIARQNRPDIIVSDVMMPRMDGVELTRAIRADHLLKDTPVILVSAAATDNDAVVAGLAAGADDYLELPQDPVRLVAKVARLGGRRRAELEAERRLRSLFSALADLVLILDDEGRYLEVAPTKAGLVHRPEDELRGRTLQEILPAATARLFLEHIHLALRTGQPQSVDYSLPIDGVEKWFEASVSPMSPTSVFWVARDVTEKRELQQKLLHSQKMEAIGRLAGGIAHDFNNLLTVITGFSEMLLDGVPQGSEMQHHGEQVLQAAARAAALTRQLLAFSRKQVRQPVALDLNVVLANLEHMLRRLLGEDVDLRTTLARDVGDVYADPGQIEQVLMNLAVNARDAMPSGGRLLMQTARLQADATFARHHVPMQPGDYVVLAVSDTGTGMDESVLAQLFEPFFTTKGPGKGTGLGLSTVYGIVQQNGGHISVYSEPGKGSTFRIYLPRISGRASVPAVKDTENAVARGTETVLVVEDNPQVRELARAVLTGFGYHVLDAASGADALALLRRNGGDVQLLLTDVVMPGIGGRALAEQLRRRFPRLRALFMSGYPDESMMNRGMLEPGTPFIEKPFTPRSLARKVREVLDA
jgi:PAS domain S-box-containing protein